jgi:peptidoglycan LD-endopeptidase LytH
VILVALKATSLARVRVLLIIGAAFLILATAFWLGTRSSGYRGTAVSPPQSEKAPGSVVDNSSTLSKAPTVSPGPASTDVSQVPESSGGVSAPSPDQEANNILSGSFIGTIHLIIPVAGVKPEQLRDTFTDARSEGRAHDAIDIMAPAGTPVLAASDGEIVRLFQSERGGTTIYQLSPDKKLVFYYAHLQSYAEGLAVGKYAKQGEVIAYIGDTGNAGAGNYHLHFSIAVLTDPKRYFEGTNINPYPLLRK